MQEKQIENLSEDINNIIKLVKEKQGKDIKIAYLYSIPSELLTYKESIELLKKKTEIDIKLFAVNDKNKYDPENKAPKAKPGKPGIFVE
jgi:hypothetical protein